MSEVAGEDRAITERLAGFVAWMATQPIDEPTRRVHRRAVESYLQWRRTGHGPADGAVHDPVPGPAPYRRRRYENHVRRHAPDQLPAVRAGLDLYAAYQRLTAQTVPIDHH